ncbi:MAG TPA: hypothetical protein VN613_05990 [Gemmatimonadaceae bacterium]|nr:hypothetical protein [Gemmatimonadaceae bacterium]
MAVLAGAFGREVDAPVQRAYYQVLSPRLTTEEFERAVTLTMAEEKFWPSPAVILAKVKPDATTQGLAALEHVNRITAKHGGFRFLPHEVFLAEFDAPTRAGISAVGGLHQIANTSDERMPTLRKKFAAAYAEALNPQPKIQAQKDEPKVKQLVAQTARVLSISGRDAAAGERP